LTVTELTLRSLPPRIVGRYGPPALDSPNGKNGNNHQGPKPRGIGPTNPGVRIATPPTERNVAMTSNVPGSPLEVATVGSTRESVTVSGVGGIKTEPGHASPPASAAAAAVLLSCGGRWICVGGEGCGLGWTAVGGGAGRGRMTAAVVVGGSYARSGAQAASRPNRSGQAPPRMPKRTCKIQPGKRVSYGTQHALA